MGRYLRRESPQTNAKMAKLTAEQIPEIRRRIAEGEMLKSIAASYGVSPTAIGSIRSGGTWSHIR